MTVSKHIQTERLDRCAFILSTIGMGKIIYIFKQPQPKYGTYAIVKITTTGIAMVMTEEDKLITMYVLTVTEAKKYFNNEIPMLLKSIIATNMRKKYHLLQNEIKY